MNRRAAMALSTFFGCGYFPWGPGSVGSLAAVLLAVCIRLSAGANTRVVLLLLTALLLWPAVWAATQTARLLQREDPSVVVVDEVLGQWITLLGAAIRNWETLLAAFFLFRLFDIWKPWPIRQFEKLPDGVGIVADDLVAGIYGACFLWAGRTLRLY